MRGEGTETFPNAAEPQVEGRRVEGRKSGPHREMGTNSRPSGLRPWTLDFRLLRTLRRTYAGRLYVSCGTAPTRQGPPSAGTAPQGVSECGDLSPLWYGAGPPGRAAGYESGDKSPHSRRPVLVSTTFCRSRPPKGLKSGAWSKSKSRSKIHIGDSRAVVAGDNPGAPRSMLVGSGPTSGRECTCSTASRSPPARG